MSLNIKNPEAHELARQVSALTGESLTDAVTESLRERLERLRLSRSPHLADRLLVIGRRCAELLPEPSGSVEHGDLLYDDRGLPR